MDILTFLENGVSTFHTVRAGAEFLAARGFEAVDPFPDLSTAPGSGYFVIGGKLLVAYSAPAKPRNAPLRLVLAHSDAPCLKIGWAEARAAASSDILRAEVYGGVVQPSWIDRDILLAGVALVEGANGVERRLFRLDDLMVRTVGVAPHLKDQKAGAAPMGGEKSLNLFLADGGDGVDLLSSVKTAVGADQELLYCDIFGASADVPRRVGAEGAYLSSGKLDNLMSCYASMAALAAAHDAGSNALNVMIWFDSEEVGSRAWLGASSTLLIDFLKRVNPGAALDESAAMAISLDVAHGFDPRVAGAFVKSSAPELNKGPAIKFSSIGNYTDSDYATAHIEKLARREAIPLQYFRYPAHIRGGSSAGPHFAAASGIPSIDIGPAVMSMHSVRELGGYHDVEHTRRLVEAFYREA